MWQSLILAHWNPLFVGIVVESTGQTDSAPFIGFMLRMILDTLSSTISPTAPQVTPQVDALLAVLQGEMSREKLQEALKLADRKSFRKRYLTPARLPGRWRSAPRIIDPTD